MRIVSSREKDGRTYDTPTASEVAALIPGDFNLDMDKRDIVLEEILYIIIDLSIT